jgi:Protein of unknown function (DUF3489)
MVYIIDVDNDVRYADWPQAPGIEVQGRATFDDLTTLDRVTRDWPLSRLQDVWNGFAGVVPFDDLKPVKKFENRKKALARIWSAIQRLIPPPAILTDGQRLVPDVASAPAESHNTPMTKTKSKGRDHSACITKMAKRAAKEAKPATRLATALAKAHSAAAERAALAKKPAKTGTKQAEVIRLMERKSGASLAEIMEKTGWQAHTVRGFVAGTLGKKLGLTVESIRSEAGHRIYRIAR